MPHGRFRGWPRRRTRPGVPEASLHVACATDGAFAPDCAVMLTSLMSRHSGASVHVHLLHDESLPGDDLKALGGLVTGAGGSFNAISDLGGQVLTLAQSERFPLRIWYRLLLAELLPELSRVLYIDADTLIAAPLQELWSTPLEGNVVAAVTNPLYASMVPRIISDLGLPDAASYFNSGVLLIDLQEWRRTDTTRAAFEFARSHPLVWPDQDVLNGVLHDRRLRLHPRWNAMPGLWELPRRYLPYSDEEVSKAASDPALIHFVGPHKPWHYRSRHPYRPQYFRCLGQTPWRGRSVEGRSFWQAFLKSLPTVWAHRTEMALARWEQKLRSSGRRWRARLQRLT
jgi:lipopolysaccharide biosynthesis glycosyltransferase